MTKLTGLVPMLLANDIEETVAFYRDKLGFSVAGTWPDDGKLTWCNLTSGDVRIMFFGPPEHDEDDGHSHDGEEDHEHDHSPSMAGFLYLYPDDVAAAWEVLKDEAEVVWPLGDMEHGMREFGIKDCNGYALIYGQGAWPDGDGRPVRSV